MSAIDTLKVSLIVMLFFSVSITLITYATPADSLRYISDYTSKSSNIDEVYGDVQTGLSAQTKLPIVEVAALVFYSGNIIVDLILNFVFAIPEMLGLLVHGILYLLNVDSYIFAVVEAFAGIAIIVFYFIGIIETLVNIRSRGVA